MQRLDEFFRRHFGLTKRTSQCADFDLAMHRDNAAFGFPLHDDVTAALAHFLKTKPLQRTLDFCS